MFEYLKVNNETFGGPRAHSAAAVLDISRVRRLRTSLRRCAKSWQRLFSTPRVSGSGF